MAPQIKQHRFDYTSDFAEEIASFAKRHSNEDRKTYKSNWLSWKTAHQDLYEKEIQFIKDQGFTGDPHAKIFESVRYYYRKKLFKQPVHVKQPKEKKLAPLSKEIVQKMDKHMKEYVLDNNKDNTIDISPATAFDDFCKTNINTITQEIYRLKTLSETKLDPITTSIKFKKSYKNRFYKIIQSNQP